MFVIEVLCEWRGKSFFCRGLFVLVVWLVLIGGLCLEVFWAVLSGRVV